MTDKLEQAVLNGSLFTSTSSGNERERDPDGFEPLRKGSRSLSDAGDESGSGREFDTDEELGLEGTEGEGYSTPPSSFARGSRSPRPRIGGRNGGGGGGGGGRNAMNTGPKGVIADFRTYADDSANRNGGDAAGVGGAGENKKSKRKTGPKGVIEDWRNYTDRSVSSSSSSSSRPAGNGKKGKSFIGKRSGSEDESGGVDDEEGIGAGENDSDREAREAYRRKRLAELSLVHRHRVNSLTVGGVVGDDDSVGKVVGMGSKGRRDGKKRVFGHLREIGAAQFTNAVEGEDGDIAVVVHIYEPSLPTCSKLNLHLSSLARLHPSTKFLRVIATEIDFAAGMEADALPTVLVYRNGELEANLVRVDLDWGRGERTDVEEVLFRNGAIDGFHDPKSRDVGRSPKSDQTDEGEDDE